VTIGNLLNYHEEMMNVMYLCPLVNEKSLMGNVRAEVVGYFRGVPKVISVNEKNYGEKNTRVEFRFDEILMERNTRGSRDNSHLD
jgi:hypothetical protein